MSNEDSITIKLSDTRHIKLFTNCKTVYTVSQKTYTFYFLNNSVKN